jgi:hypothetical protein
MFPKTIKKKEKKKKKDGMGALFHKVPLDNVRRKSEQMTERILSNRDFLPRLCLSISPTQHDDHDHHPLFNVKVKSSKVSLNIASSIYTSRLF